MWLVDVAICCRVLTIYMRDFTKAKFAKKSKTIVNTMQVVNTVTYCKVLTICVRKFLSLF